MVAAAHDRSLDEIVPLPRRALRFPIELRMPPAFRADDRSTWPAVEGRVEYLDGRLLFMPPCGEIQQDVCAGVADALLAWGRSRPEFRVGLNEAGMLLRGSTRGADAAVWRRQGPSRAGFARVPPILAVEASGAEEDEAALRDKARWYLDAGVEIVWLVLHETRDVVVLTRAGESRHSVGERLPAHDALEGLAPAVADLFSRLG